MQEYWPLLHQSCDKGLYASVEIITICRPFMKNIWILKLLYSKFRVVHCWVRTPVGARFSRPIQLPVQWVLGLFPVGKAVGAWHQTTRSVLVSRSSMGRAIPLPPLYACLACNRTSFFISLCIVINSSSGNSVMFVNFLVITVSEYYCLY